MNQDSVFNRRWRAKPIHFFSLLKPRQQEPIVQHHSSQDADYRSTQAPHFRTTPRRTGGRATAGRHSLCHGAALPKAQSWCLGVYQIAVQQAPRDWERPARSGPGERSRYRAGIGARYLTRQVPQQADQLSRVIDSSQARARCLFLHVTQFTEPLLTVHEDPEQGDAALRG